MEDTTVLERFEHLEEVWPGGSVPPHLALGAGKEIWVGARSPRRRSLSYGFEFVRDHRVAVVTTAVVAGLAAWLLLGVAPAIGEGIAESRHQEFQAAYENLDSTMAGARAALQTATDPASTNLSDAVGPLARFSVAATDLAALGAAPLPDLPPLVPSRYVSALQPVRDEAVATAGLAEGVSGRLNALVSYRLLLDSAFRLPDLPAQALDSDLDQLTGEISFMLVETSDALSRLPSDAILDGVTTEAMATLARLEEWRANYLTAITTGDAASAQALAVEAATWVGEVDDSLGQALSEFDSWARFELDGLLVAILQGHDSVG